ncbi:hypothetical protein PLEOSDRAFT_1108708 [Pleurotus ostreatus PC15]|uniref:Fungal-type protein kinase domain-containing protein n=1 Tax=Pleurotus ostreatus (strain PC15) TaxID=1137138 RepID=A0A067N7X0_PLEO1|nr:hypothetical protein PLEOSDRAFT_1108708 [Pleurotus ostreatus PC15]
MSAYDLGDTLNDVAPDLFLTELVENWRQTYARPSSRLTESLSKVKAELIKGDLLSSHRGFCQILGAQRDGGAKYEIYSHIKETVTKTQSALRQVSAEYESEQISDHPSYVTFLDGGIFLAASNEERAADCVAEKDDDELKIHDSILAAEFNKKNNPKASFDNVKKAIGAATSTLYNDPCRRHVYAMTLQGKQLRMWYFCRSHHLAPIQHPQNDFLLFLLFLISATKEELGFDPTVVRVIRRTGTVFRYKVGDVYYETVGDPLNQDAAYHISSRSTCVWKVRKVILDGAGWREDERDTELHVLRDVWLYHGSTMEKDIQDQIFGKFDEGTREKARPHFLTILQDVEVSFKTNDVERKDITPLATGLSFAILDPVTKNRILKGPRVSKAPLDQGASKISFQPSREAPKPASTSVQSSRSAVNPYTTLQTLSPLRNVLTAQSLAWTIYDKQEDTTAAVKATGIGKIPDLEYCRPYEDSKPNEPITGTPYFLPTEYSTQTYQFFPPENDGPAQKVSFNFYHDLESLIWVYIWFLFNHVPTSLLVADKGLQKAAKSLQASASSWFASEFWAMTGTSPGPWLEQVQTVVIRQSFASAQRELQKQEPDKHTRRWPRELFKDTPYTGFRDYIAKHFSSLASLPVTSLSGIIKPESKAEGDTENEDHEDNDTAIVDYAACA